MPNRFVCLAMVLAVSGVAQGQVTSADAPTATLPAELARVLTDYEKAFRQGGSDLADLFEEDGFILAGGQPPIQGRAAIERYHSRPAGAPPGGLGLALRAFAFSMSGNTAFILGGYAMRPGEPDDGKFTLTLRRRADGRWMIVSDMANGNRAAARRVPGGLGDNSR